MRVKHSLIKLTMLCMVAASIGLSNFAVSATKIMPLGDSITGSPGCWRAYLWQKLQQNGYRDIDFVGTLNGNGCSVSHDSNNEGHGGYLATNIASQNQLVGWLSATRPDVVLMHLGTNDVWSSRPTASILNAFTTLVQQMRNSNPNMKIIVAKIIPMDSSRSCASCANGVVALNNSLQNWANGLTTSNSPITIVDQWTGFNSTADTFDGVHPTDAGHQKIANNWYPAVASVLTGTSNPTVQNCNWNGTIFPICVNQSTGWGWENNKSCVGRTDCSNLVNPNGPMTSSQQCNWYGTTFPLCTNTTAGWGWENNKSCVARVDCAGLPAPYGIK